MMLKTKYRAVAVIGAAAFVLLLAGSLAARVGGTPNAEPAGIARSVPLPAPGGMPPAPAAQVAKPAEIVLADLPTPFCWGCSWNWNAPLEFTVDLDLLAPLGDGPGNAAEWFRHFVRGGARFDSIMPRDKGRRELKVEGKTWMYFDGDHPLLLEAEGWVDQATCRFYPEIWPVEGPDTKITNLLFVMDLARSWVLRGKAADDREQALADYRRAIRLGRLMRQDNVTLIQDMVAIAAIRFGAEAIYEDAREQGDAATMLVASRVLADMDAIRHQTARRNTLLLRAFGVIDRPDQVPVRLERESFNQLIKLVRAMPERRFLMEAVLGLHIVSRFAVPEQAEAAETVLAELEEQGDPMVADLIDDLRRNPPTIESMATLE
ncbi:hypothetical protein ABI59_12275 [Acidobacteria bacterium Mor1]|nr:hypothetical protein ABI59_12275 [Acidobacteria bacterium Mor1]